MKTTPSPRSPLSIGRLQAAFALAGATLLLTGTTVSYASDEAPADTCWTAEPGVVGSLDHPTDPTAVVLRMFVGGGFVPVEVSFLENPVFTLYGNNVVIFRPAGDQTDITEPLPPYQCSQLSPEQVDQLLAFALDDGGLRSAADLYRDPFIADTPNTIFTIDADGVSKQVTVQALGFNSDAPDQEARTQFQALADLLSDFGPQVESSSAYDAPLSQAMLSDVWIDQPAPAVVWPWTDLTPGDFSGQDFALATLTADQVSQVAEVPNGGQGYIVVELSDGSQQSLAVKPLLPDQLGAVASGE
jgi:hypothetical protein